MLKKRASKKEAKVKDDEIYGSIRRFARAVGRTHTTLLDWLERSDWPHSVPRNGPWDEEHRRVVVEWADQLQEDRNARYRAPHDPKASTIERCRVRAADLISGEPPWDKFEKSLGPVLFGELNVADLNDFANCLSFILADSLLDVAIARSLPGLPTQTTQSMYISLLKAVDQAKLGTCLDNVTQNWLAARFIDRPGWWSEMAQPEEPPSAEFLAKVEPLPHRVPKVNGKAKVEAAK